MSLGFPVPLPHPTSLVSRVAGYPQHVCCYPRWLWDADFGPGATPHPLPFHVFMPSVFPGPISIHWHVCVACARQRTIYQPLAQGSWLWQEHFDINNPCPYLGQISWWSCHGFLNLPHKSSLLIIAQLDNQCTKNVR